MKQANMSGAIARRETNAGGEASPAKQQWTADQKQRLHGRSAGSFKERYNDHLSETQPFRNKDCKDHNETFRIDLGVKNGNIDQQNRFSILYSI